MKVPSTAHLAIELIRLRNAASLRELSLQVEEAAVMNERAHRMYRQCVADLNECRARMTKRSLPPAPSPGPLRVWGITQEHAPNDTLGAR